MIAAQSALVAQPQETPHLFAAVAALALAAAALIASAQWSTRLERRTIHEIAPVPFQLKSQGIALQEEALRQPDILPIYGSSELVKPIPNKASIFFQHAPTGFEVSPVGKAGTTSLIILQKFAALGPDLRGKKIAISVSPGWFFIEVLNPHYYDGNFSVLQASDTVFGSSLSLELKRDIARRMLQFPRTVEKSALLESALDNLVEDDSVFHRWLYYATMPLGRLQTEILRLQDHFETMLYVTQEKPTSADPDVPNELAIAPTEPPDWPALLANAEKQTGATANQEDAEDTLAEPGDAAAPPQGRTAVKSGGDRMFLEKMQRAREWTDFELLLRTLKELGAKPLLLSMPINGQFYDSAGVPRTARDVYYRKIHELAARYGTPLLAFEDHDEDENFLMGHHDHLSQKGWTFYDKTLDDFFHDRLEK